MAIARLTKRLMEGGVGVEGVRVMKDLTERDIRGAAEADDERTLVELALRILYQRKTFREVTGTDPEHFLGPAEPHKKEGPKKGEKGRGPKPPKGHKPPKQPKPDSRTPKPEKTPKGPKRPKRPKRPDME
jgi:hypothetical protein